MRGIQTFQGSIVRPAAAVDVVSPAYDALSSSQRRAFRSANPNSYLHVTRSAADEIDADTVDNETLVARGRAALDQLLSKDLFATHGDPAFYVYRLTQAGHVQFGLVCEVPAEHFAAVAKPHEATQPARARLLAEHFTTVKAASSPIACAVRDEGQLAEALRSVATESPVLDLLGDDGLQQTVWRVSSADLEAQLHSYLDDADLFIIDGHHRAAANRQILDDGISVPVLTAIFPEIELQLVGFHRLVKLPIGVTEEALVAAIERRFPTERTSDVSAVEPGTVAMFAIGEWHIVRFDQPNAPTTAEDLLRSLDPVVVEREILEAIVGATGEIDVTYQPDTEPFAVIVADARADGRVPFFVAPVRIEDMMGVAAGGVIMPPKSTYFTPKVRSGLFLRLLHEAD